MKVRLLLLALIFSQVSILAQAGVISVLIKDSGGMPVPGVVVTMRPASDAEGAAKPQPISIVIDQINETYVPLLQVVPVGSSLTFRNSDHVRHHVYSFSQAKSFEFILTPGTSSPAVPLTKSGLITIGCNIHDQMIAYVSVTEAPYSAMSGNDGKAVFSNVPHGLYHGQAWHPLQKGGKAPQEFDVELKGESAEASATLSVAYDLLPEDNPERSRY